MKRFNVTGNCIPEEDYMVDIGGKIAEIKKVKNDKLSFFTFFAFFLQKPLQFFCRCGIMFGLAKILYI
ncbi:MAG: hypothetical protein FWH48_07180 [Oscillospiraceae bacterium]|nr:hypothetical protein [Oscillospiraceae bacterium]